MANQFDDARGLTVSAPKRSLPAGACDTHAHVFGPFERFPLRPGLGYVPPLASADLHEAMLEKLGFERAVIVQASAYSTDNRCTLDAIARAPGKRKGIGVVNRDVTDDELAALRSGGVTGMRFTEIRAKATGERLAGASGFDDLFELGARMRRHDMHAQIFAGFDDIMAAADRLLALDIPLVFDHMARVGPSDRRVDDPGFQRLVAMLKEGRIWVKLIVFRNTHGGCSYEDVRAFHDAMVEANPDNLVWGTDWPLLNTGNAPPDPGRLIDLLDDWLGEDELRRKILVSNPARLYGFGD